MARGDRVIAASEQLAQLINDRYGTPWERIAVLPSSIDFERFDPAQVTRERVETLRRSWGIKPDTKVILVVGRILRRKGHHVMVRAAQRLKDMGFKDFLCVFVGEDRGHTHYTGELWDLVLTTRTMDVIRMAAPVADMPAAYAAAAVVVSAAVQPEGLQRSIIEAQAMGRPVIVSDLGAGPDVVLTAPAVPDGRVTGLRYAAGDDAALAEALVRLFSMPEPNRRAIGARGRELGLRPFRARLWSPSRRCGFMPRLPAARWRLVWCHGHCTINLSNLRALARFRVFLNTIHWQRRRNRVDLFAVSTNLCLSE